MGSARQDLEKDLGKYKSEMNKNLLGTRVVDAHQIGELETERLWLERDIAKNL